MRSSGQAMPMRPTSRGHRSVKVHCGVRCARRTLGYPNAWIALIDALIAEEDGKMATPLPRGLPEIFTATRRLLGRVLLPIDLFPLLPYGSRIRHPNRSRETGTLSTTPQQD